MVSIDTYLHIIGIALLAMLAIVLALIDTGKTKRTLSRLFLTVLGFMLAHFVTHLLPNSLAEFIYSSHHQYHSVKPSGLHRT
ncbi:hypothetical protein [Methylomonas methanica]|uniref:Uncharacterized protein n=1 Tax=Methylomonas methanica (strain DSM 25384 / MC09) TaxID=857087 RepID=G0A2M5_METMM|nr:hypothetical protein [Methylomonas methanica]AEG00205.1 hypothetical protein Metme_1787 [Methylomonas methanica MC09]